MVNPNFYQPNINSPQPNSPQPNYNQPTLAYAYNPPSNFSPIPPGNFTPSYAAGSWQGHNNPQGVPFSANQPVIYQQLQNQNPPSPQPHTRPLTQYAWKPPVTDQNIPAPGSEITNQPYNPVYNKLMNQLPISDHNVELRKTIGITDFSFEKMITDIIENPTIRGSASGFPDNLSIQETGKKFVALVEIRNKDSPESKSMYIRIVYHPEKVIEKVVMNIFAEEEIEKEVIKEHFTVKDPTDDRVKEFEVVKGNEIKKFINETRQRICDNLNKEESTKITQMFTDMINAPFYAGIPSNLSIQEIGYNKFVATFDIKNSPESNNSMQMSIEYDSTTQRYEVYDPVSNQINKAGNSPDPKKMIWELAVYSIRQEKEFVKN